MPEPLFTGVAVALVTLFDDDGQLDAKATADHAAALVELGVQAVVVAGSTGEAATLSADERIALLMAVRHAVPTGTPVLAGTGAPSRRQAAALTRDAVEHGAAGLLVLSPPGAVDLLGYYETVVAAAGDVPVLGYHFPAVSPPGIPVGVLPDLPVRGVKDSSGDPGRLLDERTSYDGWLYTGAASVLSLAGPLGCTGAILALANAEPERCSAAFAGDADAQLALTAAHRASQRDFPHGLKALVADRFGTSRTVRLG
jgi:4-hydroxy-tetrahydrodipicolinate synthase